MARFCEPTAKQLKDWKKWVAKRPPVVKALGERFDPWTLYRLDGGDRVFVVSFCEDGTLTVAVTRHFNLVLFERQVFGIKPESLVECDLPDEDEPLGVAIEKPTEEDFAAMREAMGIKHKHAVN